METRGPNEARLLHVERGIEALDRQVRNLRTRAIAVAQGVWGLWSEVSSLESTPPMMPATYSGTLEECFFYGASGVTITLQDHVTSAVITTIMTTTGGAFSGTLTVPSGGQAIDFVVTLTGYATSTTTVTIVPGSNSIGTITLSAGTGRVCTSFCGSFPASTTQTLVDSVYGNCTLTWTGTLWQGTSTGIAYSGYGAGGCSAATIAITYQLLTGGNINLKWQVNGSFCPVASGTLVSILFGGVPSCGGPTPVITATNNSGSGELKALREGAASQTFTVTLV